MTTSLPYQSECKKRKNDFQGKQIISQKKKKYEERESDSTDITMPRLIGIFVSSEKLMEDAEIQCFSGKSSSIDVSEKFKEPINEVNEEIPKLGKKVTCTKLAKTFYETLEISIDLYDADRKVGTELLDLLRSIEVDQYSEQLLLPHLQRIVVKFNRTYKDPLLEKVKLKAILSDEEAVKVNCLTLTVSLLSLIGIEDNLPHIAENLVAYLKVLNESLHPNVVAARMTQIFMTSICNVSDRCQIIFSEEERETLSRTFTTYRDNDLVRIPSAYLLVVMFNRRNEVKEDAILEAVTYLREIMDTNKSFIINGFCMGARQKGEIQSAYSKTFYKNSFNQIL